MDTLTTRATDVYDEVARLCPEDRYTLEAAHVITSTTMVLNLRDTRTGVLATVRVAVYSNGDVVARFGR